MTAVRALAFAATLLAAAVALAQLEPASRAPSNMVAVRDVRSHDGVVTGVLINSSDHPVRDVRVLVRQTWQWADERHPGEDSPSTAGYYTLTDEIPGTGKLEFTIRPREPLPHRTDGQFQTAVDVVGMTEVSR